MCATVASSPVNRRKPVSQATQSTAHIPGKPTIIADAIAGQVKDLWASNDPREYSRVIARRLGCSEAVVDRIIVGLMLEYERRTATLTEAAKNGLSMASEAGREVWGEAA